ncbi:MAG: hypothetical protein RI931_344, partial [Actinomycetota bacterium]
RVIADAVAEGLIARHTKPEAAAEPLAEWERELLEQGATAAAVEAPAVVEAAVVATETAEVAAPEVAAETAPAEAVAVEEAK